MLGSWRKIARHPSARNCGEQGKRIPQWNVFAERNEMNLAINLHTFSAVRNEERRVVIMLILEVQSAEHQIRFYARREIPHESIAHTVRIARGIRCRALRPNE